MGLLDGLLNEITGSLSPTAGQQSGLLKGVLGSFTNNQEGGLQGLLGQMKEKGLGGVAASWVSTNANQAITPEQIRRVLGNEKIQQFADQHGIDVDQVANHLAEILPVVVDKLTPNGQLPADDETTPNSGGVADLLKGFLGGNKQ